MDRNVGDKAKTDESVSAQTDDVTESDCSEAGKMRKGRRIKRRKTRSPSLTYHSITQRISLASSTLSIPEDISVESAELVTSNASSINFCSMSHEKKLTVINFCTTNFFVGCFYSLLGPFFPTEAAKKGVSTTFVGLIFAAFELTIVIASPIFGNYLTRIGAKFLYVAGVMVCGTGALLFGFLDGCPDGTIYIVMCFLVRSVEAIGAAALATASFAIMANTFPDHVATMFGSLELFSGLGLMIGPPLGGALFQLGGFRLPFVSLGSALLVVGIITIFVLPQQDVVRMPADHSMFKLLRIPIVTIMGICLMSGSGSIGFIDVTLSIYLKEQYNLSPVILGLVFLVGPGVYALTAPMWGWIVDKTPRYNKIFICCGYTLGGFAFYLMGPAPFLPIPHMLWLVIVSMALMGFGIGTLVITFQVITEATMAAGYQDSLDTYGLIAGVFNAFFCFGAFAGPLGGGYLHDLLHFEMSAVVIGSCSLFAALLLFTHIVVTSCCSSFRQMPVIICGTADVVVTEGMMEKQHLLKNGHVPQPYSIETDDNPAHTSLQANNDSRQDAESTTMI
jgi:MFS family permease